MTTAPTDRAPRTFWVRPKCDDARAFDTGYCTEARPSLGSGSPTDEELLRRGFVRAVDKSHADRLEAELRELRASPAGEKIYHLERENARLRRALENIAAMLEPRNETAAYITFAETRGIARIALKAGEGAGE